MFLNFVRVVLPLNSKWFSFGWYVKIYYYSTDNNNREATPDLTVVI